MVQQVGLDGLGVVPEDNDVSRSLQAEAREAAARLEGLSGAAFDSAYVEREVAFTRRCSTPSTRR